MSLPSYIVNLEEFVDAIKNAFDSPALMNLGHQRSYGLQLDINTSDVGAVHWIAPTDIAVTGIRFGVNDLRNIGYTDTFDMYIDGEEIFTNVYLKEMYEYKKFRQFYQVPSGKKIEFVFSNRDKMKKQVWFDIDYIEKEITAKKIIIICKDKADGSVIQESEMLVIPPKVLTILAPNVDGYVINGTDKYDINLLPYSPDSTTIVFEYDKIPPPPPKPDPDIDHDFDWKITLRWAGNCDTDLDLHGVFSNGDVVYYKNKEIGTGNNKAWLDYDYTSHNDSSDWDDKPEIITILGKISDSIEIYVDGYSETDDLTGDVEISVDKVKNSKLENIKTITVPAHSFYGDQKVYICEIDLVSETVN